MRVVIINFSGRRDGNCSQIASFIAEKIKKNDIKIFEFSKMAVKPCGKCEYECFKTRSACPFIKDKISMIYDTITNADIAYYIIPNYSDYPCANYFIFNERSQCFFQKHKKLFDQFLSVKKKFIVITNTEEENFIKILSNQIDNQKMDILFLNHKKYGKISINSDLITSQKAVSDIQNFILKFSK